MPSPSNPPPGSRPTRRLVLKTLGFVALVAAALGMFVAYAGYEAQSRWQRAAETVAAEAGARAAALQDWLLRADRTLSWFRAEDLAAADRLGVTARMLHNERFVAPAHSLFLLSPAGRLVTGTLPLPEDPAAIAARRWFKTVQAGPARLGLQLTACTRDPFGTGEGMVVYRTIFDRDAVAGYVGSFLPQAALAGLLRDDDAPAGAVHLTLLTATGQAFGCATAVAAAQAAAESGLRAWVSRALQAWPAAAQQAVVADERTIGPGGLRLIATADALDAMSDEDWAALTYRAAYVVASLVLIVALVGSMLARHGRPPRGRPPLYAPHDPAEGADWMWELDEGGRLVGLAGNVPEHLLPPSRRLLAEMAGPVGGKDARWERFNAAIDARQAFEGLHLPFQIPGRQGTVTIFALSGQPVVASRGFWGTASLVCEESMARPKRAMLRAHASLA